MTVRTLHPEAVLYEDNHCLVVNKPPRLLTAGDHTGDVSLFDLAKEYLRQKYNKPGDVFLGVVHRLDRPVSGVVLFARTSKAASRLAEQFRTRAMDKVYWAGVTGGVRPVAGQLEDWLVKDHDDNLTSVASPRTPGAKLCRLNYRSLQNAGANTLLEIHPETGRSHQIRVQLASRRWPILGDRKYGSQELAGGQIALHAVQLTFQHPTLSEAVRIRALPPNNWKSWFPGLHDLSRSE